MNEKLTVNLVSLSFPKRDLSIALLYLKGYAEKDGFIRDHVDIRVVQFEKDEDTDDIYESLRTMEGGLFGFSCYVWNTEKILPLVARLKKDRPNVRILLGGPQATALKAELMGENDSVDYVISGEGEVPFYRLLKNHFILGESPAGIGGVSYREGGRIVPGADSVNRCEADRIVLGDDARPVENLSELVLPHVSEDYSLFLDAIDAPVTAQVETTRGCPFSCRYCSWYNGQKVRKFDLEQVFRVFRFLFDHEKVAKIYVTDSNAFIFKARQKEVLRFIIENNHRKIPVIFELNPQFLDDELIALLSEMGAEELAFGLQSTSKEVLRNINRKFNGDTYREKIFRLKEMFPRVKTWFGLILGLPGDTFDSFLDSLEFAIQLKPYSLYIHELLVLPGSRFYQNPGAYGLVFENKPPYRVLSNGSMTPDEYLQLKYIGFIVSLLHHMGFVRERMLDLHHQLGSGRLVDLYLQLLDFQPLVDGLPSKEEVSGMSSIDFDPAYERLKGDTRFGSFLKTAFQQFEESLWTGRNMNCA